ncbi:MAG: DUF2254 domain-containing protein, partial [Acidimicrobiales bacterium]
SDCLVCPHRAVEVVMMGGVRLRASALAERLRASLFFVPMVAVVAAVLVGFLGLAVDRQLDEQTTLPLGLTSTVASARAVLSTIAGATISFAGIAFSISLLIIQLASTQYSPRVVHTLFRDPFNKRVMALVVGTFTYCVIVLRSVRSPLEDGGRAVIPNLSVAVAVLLGIVTILAIVAFINHSAHAMDVSEILERVRGEAIGHVRADWAPVDPDRPVTVTGPALSGPCWVARFDRSGWVQQSDRDALLQCTPAASTLLLDTFPGRYAIEGTPLCTLSPPPADSDDIERHVRAAIAVGTTRTMQQDVSYGLRQLADVALKALSPGINDPTTAQDAIFHATAVLAELLPREPPPRLQHGPHGQQLVVAHQPTHADLVALAFDETRRAAAAQPTVCVYLLEALHLLKESLDARGLDDRIPPLVDQARLIVAGCEAAGLLPADIEQVRRAFTRRFGPSA